MSQQGSPLVSQTGLESKEERRGGYRKFLRGDLKCEGKCLSGPSKGQGKQEAAREKANSHQLQTPARCSQAWAASSASIHYIREGKLRGRQVSRAIDCRHPGRLRTLQFLKLKLGLSNAPVLGLRKQGGNGKSGLGVECKGF